MDETWEVDKDSTLLPLLEKADGHSIAITQNGEVIGKVVPTAKRDPEKAKAAMEAILALNLKLNLAPGETIMDWIREGRRE